MSRHSVRVCVEYLVDDQVVQRNTREEFVQEGQIDIDRVTAGALAMLQKPAGDKHRQAEFTKPREDPEPEASSLTLTTAPSAIRPERAISFQDGAWVRMLEELTAAGKLHESLRGLTSMSILTHVDVRRESQALDLSGVMGPLRYVLIHGPIRCRQVRQWAAKISKAQSVKNVAALIVSVLEKGEPRGPQKRRQQA